MDKQVYREVSERADGKCEYCGVETDVLQLHHILRRVPAETPDNCVMLCLTCHDELHRGENSRKMDLTLKLKLQAEYFKQGHTESEVRQLMGGKIYLDQYVYTCKKLDGR